MWGLFSWSSLSTAPAIISAAVTRSPRRYPDTVVQPTSPNSARAGCSTSWSSVKREDSFEGGLQGRAAEIRVKLRPPDFSGEAPWPVLTSLAATACSAGHVSVLNSLLPALLSATPRSPHRLWGTLWRPQAPAARGSPPPGNARRIFLARRPSSRRSRTPLEYPDPIRPYCPSS